MRLPITRERLLRVLLPSAAFFVTQPAHAAVKISNGVEEIRKAASIIPGYGPPDIAFPSVFRGRWQVQSRVVDVKTPLGEETAPKQELQEARTLMAAAQPLAFEARFLDVDNAGGIAISNERSDAVALSAKTYSGTVIADRSFNAERRAAAQPGAAALVDYTARWDPGNPNVLTLSCKGSVTEYKVTKRSFEAPFDGAFGTSEYSRIADAGSAGVISAVPKIMARRVQTRFKWDIEVADGGQVRRIEALELAQTFDPTATGFADLAGATPVLTVKSRLIFTR